MPIQSSSFLLLVVAIPLSFALSGFSREIRGKPISALKKTSAPTNAVSANAETPPVLTSASSTKGDYVEIGFDRLAGYTFEIPENNEINNAANAKTTNQIPADVKAFDQKKVSVKGFMLPLKVDDGVVTEMLIMKDQSMCCYGSVPRINDWVSVKMKNGGVKSVMDEPVTLYGKLRVGEILENGYLVGIYEMEGHKMGE